VTAALFALVAVSGTAFADPCERGVLPAPRPIGLSDGPADFATTPSACAETRADVAGRASLLVDTPDFYGMLFGDVLAHGEYALGDVWLGASLAAIERRFVQNATIVATRTDLGPATLSAHFVALGGDRERIAPFLRALLPTGTAYRYAVSFGAEPGVAAVLVPTARTAVTIGLSTPATWTVLGSRVRATFEPRVSLDAAFAPWTWLEPAAGLEVRMGGDAAGPLETVAPSVAVRIFPWRDLQASLAAAFPLVGEDRTDLWLRVAAGWAF